MKPTVQLKSKLNINDDPSLENEADRMGAKALEDNELPTRQLKKTSTSSSGTVQRKKKIKGTHNYEGKGRLNVDFEERQKGSGAGMYGVITFLPQADGGVVAKKIDLVQITSMTTNLKGQAQYEKELEKEIEKRKALEEKSKEETKEKPKEETKEKTKEETKEKPTEEVKVKKKKKRKRKKKKKKKIEEKEVDTSGNPRVKDMWRYNDKFHVDLLGEGVTPRKSTEDPVFEEGYNSERRGGKWKDPLDEVTMSTTEDVIDEYKVMNAKRTGKPLANSSTRKITQDPGSNDGKGKVKKTELFDYPGGPSAVVASFHTTIDADGTPWGTVKWGFTSINDIRQSETVVKSTQGPVFSEGQTEEMKEARKIFNDIMANPSSWTSPEAFSETLNLLNSKERTEYEKGVTWLKWMAEALDATLRKIDSVGASKEVLEQFARPHLIMAGKVLDEMDTEKMQETKLYTDLDGLERLVRGKLK